MSDINYETEPMAPGVIILADGRTKDNHLGNERLFTPINGVPLIVRTIQQFNKWANVGVLSRDQRIAKIVKPQRRVHLLYADDESRRYHGVDMIRKGLSQAYARRSIIVFGDVVFTDEAVATIRDHEIENHFAVYGRSVASTIGSPWAEYFAIEVDWLGREYGKGAVEAVASFYNMGEWKFCTAWEWYYHMEKMPYDSRANPGAVKVGPNWVEINDATDDIDFESDIERMKRAHATS